LKILVTCVGEPSVGWAQVSPQADNEAERGHANAIDAIVDGFEFRLLGNQSRALGWTNTELTSEQKS
jgi:hypothetical protein